MLIWRWRTCFTASCEGITHLGTTVEKESVAGREPLPGGDHSGASVGSEHGKVDTAQTLGLILPMETGSLSVITNQLKMFYMLSCCVNVH